MYEPCTIRNDTICINQVRLEYTSELSSRIHYLDSLCSVTQYNTSPFGCTFKCLGPSFTPCPSLGDLTLVIWVSFPLEESWSYASIVSVPSTGMKVYRRSGVNSIACEPYLCSRRKSVKGLLALVEELRLTD